MDIGLPHYVASERNPEHGCELKTEACGRSGICLRIETVVSAQEMNERDYEGDNSHGADVLMRLMEPWFQSNRVVRADSSFASVHSAEQLFDHGLRLTGVIKTATKSFPMTFLSHLEMSGKGQHVTMVSKGDDGPDLMAVMWVDRGRRYFVSSAGTTNPGTAIYHERLVKKNGFTSKEQSNIEIPDVCEEYYESFCEIDRHNCCRQDNLKLEEKFIVKDCSTRVNTSLLGICIIDAWKLYAGSRGDRKQMSPNEFYCQLADGLIDNTEDGMTTKQRSSDIDESMSSPSSIGCGVGTHLTITSRKRKKADGSVTSSIYQGRCAVCKSTNKSKYICSTCEDCLGKEVFLCHGQTERDCFKKHVDFQHNLSYKGSFY